jgi:hypothetical protein
MAMKFFQAICVECFFSNQRTTILQFDANDKGIYETQCTFGHNQTYVLQNNKFEILFELGAIKMEEGELRGAVLDFAGSMERFFEFCIRVFTQKHNINSTIFNKTWKLVSNDSQKQLAVFYFLYMLELNESPPKLDEKQAKFRNSVIHKGVIPTYEEVYSYANYLYTYMTSILKLIVKNYSHEIMRLTIASLEERSSMVHGKFFNGCMNTIISAYAIPQDIPFKVALERSLSVRKLISNSIISP